MNVTASGRATLVWAFAPALIAAILVLRPLLAMRGIPAFVHDWSWPPDADAAWSVVRDAVHPLIAGNFGQPNVYIGGTPAEFVIALVIGIFGSILGLKVLAIGLVLLASLGTFAFAKRTGATSPVAAAAALVFSASPVVANQFAAGHLGDLFGYAMLPFVAVCGLSLARGEHRRVAALGLLVAVQLSLKQQQYAIFDALVLAAFVPFAVDARGRWCATIAAFLALLAAPYEVALALFGHPLAAFGFQLTNLLYERANSGAFWPSHIGAAYVRAYDTGAGAVAIWLRAIGGIGLWMFALWNAVTRRYALALLALAIGTAWICAGVNGPLWPVMAAAFERVPQLSLFRELYHFSSLLLFALAALLALARGGRATVAVGAVALFFALPQLSGAFWELSASYDPSEVAAIAQVASADRSDGYVLYWPLLQPLGERIGTSGADPDAFPIGSHPSLSEFTIQQPLAQLDALLCDPHVDGPALLAHLGVRYVVVRPGWSSYYWQALEPSVRAYVAKHRAGACAAPLAFAHLRTVWSGPTHALLVVDDPAPRSADPPTDAIYRLELDRPFAPSELTPDPRSAWVDASRWQWWDPSFLGPVNPGIFSTGGTPFTLPPRSGPVYLVLNAPAGATLEGDKQGRIPPAPGYRAVALPESVVSVVSRGPAVLSGYIRSPQAVVRRLPAFTSAPPLGFLPGAGLIVQYACWFAGALAFLTLAWLGLRSARKAIA